MKLAIKKPKILPKLDFEDHIPTRRPSSLSEKDCPNKVKVEGKNVS
jgi:hypothetical protein